MHDFITAPPVTRFSFPLPISPTTIEKDTSYVIAVSSSVGVLNFIGPFIPASVPTMIGPEIDLVQFQGNYRLRGYFPKENKHQTILIPKDGRAQIYGLTYALYEYTEKLGIEMQISRSQKAESERKLRAIYGNDQD